MDKALEKAPQHYRDFLHRESGPEEPDYNQGIPCARDLNTGNLISIRLTPKTRIGLFGGSGSGKTLFAKSMMSRAWKGGYKIYAGSDLNNDFQKVNRKGGVSKRLVRDTQGLLRGEESTELSRTLGVPSFMVKKYSSRPDSYATRFALGLQDITKSDLKYLVGFSNFSETQKDLWKEVMASVDLDQTSMRGLIKEFEGERGQTGEIIARKLRPLYTNQILKTGARSGMDILREIKKDRIFSLGLKNWEDFYPNNIEKLRFYSAIMQRNFIKLIKKDVIQGPFIVFYDEMHYICPNGEESPAKKEFQRILDIAGRRNQISTLISAQRPSQIPWTYSDDPYDFLGTLNHIFLAEGLPSSDWKKVVKSTNLWDQHHSDKWQDRMRYLDEHQFLYINTKEHSSAQDAQVVESLAPLCSHPEE